MPDVKMKIPQGRSKKRCPVCKGLKSYVGRICAPCRSVGYKEQKDGSIKRPMKEPDPIEIISEELFKAVTQCEKAGINPGYFAYVCFCVCGGTVLKSEGEKRFKSHVLSILKNAKAKSP